MDVESSSATLASGPSDAEVALGGVAVATNGSIWPTKGQEVIQKVQELQSLGLDSRLAGVLQTIACGILEAHLSLYCTFIATSPHQGKFPANLARRMVDYKKRQGCVAGEFGALMESFVVAEKIHSVIDTAYRNGLETGVSPDQEALFANIDRVLGLHDAQSREAQSEDLRPMRRSPPE